VLDPFAGSGTTGRVAIELRRRAILLDLAYGHDYGPLAKKRTSNVQTGMFR
jgi:DNA modification methylase